MSVYDRVYICRLAPCSETWRDAIYHGVDVIHRGKRWTESFSPDAFITTETPVPVVLSHADEKIVGHVTSRTTHGGWHIAAFKLDHDRNLSAVAADRLRVGVPVSIGFRTLRHDPILAETSVLRHTVARLDELSVLAADEVPALPGARITSILERSKRSPAVSLDRLAVGDTVLQPGVLVRHGCGQVLGVR